MDKNTNDNSHINIPDNQTSLFESQYPGAFVSPKQKLLLTTALCSNDHNLVIELQKEIALQSSNYLSSLVNINSKDISKINETPYNTIQDNVTQHAGNLTNNQHTPHTSIQTPGEGKPDETYKRETCTLCGKSVIAYNIKIHMKTHSTVRDQHICGICGKRYLHIYSLIKHNREYHRDTFNTANKVLDRHICVICETEHNSVESLKVHKISCSLPPNAPVVSRIIL